MTVLYHVARYLKLKKKFTLPLSTLLKLFLTVLNYIQIFYVRPTTHLS